MDALLTWWYSLGAGPPCAPNAGICPWVQRIGLVYATLGIIALHYALSFVMTRLEPRVAFTLTKRAVASGMTRRRFMAEVVPRQVLPVLLFTPIGLLALRTGVSLMALHPDKPAVLGPLHATAETATFCGLVDGCCVVGLIMGGYNNFGIYKLLAGLQTGWPAWIHHFTLFGPTFIVPLYLVGAELSVMSTAMELSTIFMCMVDVTRDIEVHPGLAFALLLAFALVFFVVRLVLFSVTLVRTFNSIDSVGGWMSNADGVDALTAMRRQMYVVMAAAVTIIQLLNIVFFVMIVQKIKRAGSRGAWPDMWRFFAGKPALHEAGAKKE